MYRHPRKVTQEDINAFEKQYPLYRGIGRLMIREGIWTLAETDREKNTYCGGSPEQQLSRTVNQAATSTQRFIDISMSSAGRCGR